MDREAVDESEHPKIVETAIITSHEKYPDGLMAIPPIKEGGTPRIIVPIDVQRDLHSPSKPQQSVQAIVSLILLAINDQRRGRQM